jgi:type IV secretion system protein VirB4
MSAVLDKQTIMNTDPAAGSNIPYRAMLDPHTIKTDNGDFMQIIRIGGAAHESADVSDIDDWRERLNTLWRNIASPSTALWTHIVRREDDDYPEGEYVTPFCRQLNDKYRKSLQSETLLVNELYITVIHRPNALIPGFLSRMAQNTTPEQLREANLEGLDQINDLSRTIMEGMVRYDPVRLGTYVRKGIEFTEAGEFLAYLVNGEWQRMPLPRKRFGDALCTSRPFFGNEAFELRAPTKSMIGATLAFKEYPSSTEPGMLNALLSVPFPFVLSQSYTFMSKAAAVKMMTKQRDIMDNAGDLAVSQIEAIDYALDDLVSGEFVMGEHHLSLTILADTMKMLNERIAVARTPLSDVGAIVVREDLALEASFYAQLPANFKFRPRLAPITSRNLAGFSSFHNYPVGRKSGNVWGDAVTLLRTTSGAPYYFNFHAAMGNEESEFKAAMKLAKQESEETENSAAKQSDNLPPGHTSIIGPTGEGKTALQAFLQSMLDKFDATDIYFDANRGLKLFVKAKGGQYFDNKIGQPTGFNPFQLDDTPANVAFLVRLVRKCATVNDEVLTATDDARIHNAVETVMKLPREGRRFSRLLSTITDTEQDGLGQRLLRWCKGKSEGWVFDNEVDQLDVTKYKTFGFDTTDFLDNEVVRGPIMMYLFYRIRQLVDGRRLSLTVDEFQKALNDEFFVKELEDIFSTWRKLNAFVVFATVSPNKVLESKIGKIVIQNCPTQVYFPNDKADPADYVNGFKLTNREYEIIRKELMPKSRRFLVKQGKNSTVCSFNLRGFDDELAILAGNPSNVTLADNIMKIYGHNPAEWLPKFHQQRKSQ